MFTDLMKKIQSFFSPANPAITAPVDSESTDNVKAADHVEPAVSNDVPDAVTGSTTEVAQETVKEDVADAPKVDTENNDPVS